MPNERARNSRAHVAFHRAVGTASKRRRLPKQVPPTRIMDAYTDALLVLFGRVERVCTDLMHDMPAILEASRRARMDVDEPAKVRALINQVEAAAARAVTQRDVQMIAERFAVETSTHQRVQLGRQVKAALGVELPIGDKGLRTRIEGFAAENAALIKGLSQETISAIEKASLRAVQDGKLYGDLQQEITERFNIGERRARLIARDQIGKLAGQLNADRQRGLGITEFIWRTVNDGRVRDEHETRDGEKYSYEDPPDGELPGEPIQCRCSAEPVFDGILGT